MSVPICTRGEKSCVRGVVGLWGKQRGVKAALAEYRVFLFVEGNEDRQETQDNPASTAGYAGASPAGGYAGASKTQDPRTGEWKTRVGIDARKVWEERKRGGRLPLPVMLRLKSRYLVDGAAIGSAEFLRRLTGKSDGMEENSQELVESSEKRELPPQASGREGVAMRFGQWGGLRVLRDLRVRVVG